MLIVLLVLVSAALAFTLRAAWKQDRRLASLAEAMGRHPEYFDELCHNVVQVGESTGALEQALRRLAEFKEKAHRLRSRVVTALIYPAEYEDEIAAWLNATGYAGGDLAEGGSSHVTDYYAADKAILDRQQLWNQPAIPSRSADEVLRTVRQAVQR